MRRRRALVALAWVVAVLLLSTMGLWALQRRLIYFPDGSSPPVDRMGPGWEEVSYVTGDGLELAAWFRPPEPDRAVVLVFNGNAGNRGDRAALGARLAAAGLGVVLTDYRGYGGNPGHPSEDGLAADAAAALGFVRQRAPGHAVAYFGESLGAAVALRLATVEPPAALVLRSPFTALADVGRVHYPWLPVGAFLKDRYPSLDRIGGVAVPTLVVAGDADSIIPVEQSREIYETAPGPKELLVIPGADHNDSALTAGPAMIRAAVAFIAAATG